MATCASMECGHPRTFAWTTVVLLADLQPHLHVIAVVDTFGSA
jgi:hypothetical protein